MVVVVVVVVLRVNTVRDISSVSLYRELVGAICECFATIILM